MPVNHARHLDNSANRGEPAVSDAQLMAKAAGGDRMAASTIIHRHQAPVRAFLRSLGADENQADELARQAFIDTIRGARRFDPDRPMRAGLLAAVLRRLPKKAEPPSSPGQQPPQTSRRRLLQEAMLSLTESQRRAVLLVHQQGLPLDEAARLMGVRLTTFKTHLHGGRAALRTVLEPQMESAGL